MTDTEGNALAVASVSVVGTFTGVQTGADGNYWFNGLKEGEYTIRFSFIGYEPGTTNLILKSDTVVDAVLNPVAVLTDDVIITATRAGDQAPLAYTNVTGYILEKHNS